MHLGVGYDPVINDGRQRYYQYQALVDSAERDPNLHYKVAVVGNSHIRDLALLPYDEKKLRMALLANRLCSIGYFGVGWGSTPVLQELERPRRET